MRKKAKEKETTTLFVKALPFQRLAARGSFSSALTKKERSPPKYYKVESLKVAFSSTQERKSLGFQRKGVVWSFPLKKVKVKVKQNLIKFKNQLRRRGRVSLLREQKRELFYAHFFDRIESLRGETKGVFLPCDAQSGLYESFRR